MVGDESIGGSTAEDIELGRYVALKFLTDELSRDPQGVRAISQGGTRGFRSKPPKYLHHLRNRQTPRAVFHCNGIPGRRDGSSY
jgi:hypothetical protein